MTTSLENINSFGGINFVILNLTNQLKSFESHDFDNDNQFIVC